MNNFCSVLPFSKNYLNGNQIFKISLKSKLFIDCIYKKLKNWGSNQ